MWGRWSQGGTSERSRHPNAQHDAAARKNIIGAPRSRNMASRLLVRTAGARLGVEPVPNFLDSIRTRLVLALLLGLLGTLAMGGLLYFGARELEGNARRTREANDDV